MASVFSRDLAASHSPVAFPSSTLARPASVIRPSAISCSTLLTLRIDHMLRCLRGENLSLYRLSSRLRSVPSIQPKQSASSTAASRPSPGLRPPTLVMINQASDSLA